MAKKKRRSKKADNRLIKSNDEAFTYSSKFKLVDGCELVYVTENGYLFYSHTAAINFVKEKELFTVKLK